ncbi:hypothetical protein F5Y15DRAFT_190560 [Xylariaceae sp. FL0016]|nr:hypothetical protein F5Y15DRAFT_190560 [Xylariaceae sp. FL0016]
MNSSHRFMNDPADKPRIASPSHEMLASLARIRASNPPVHTCSTGWSFSGLYAGPTSVAYLFYRLSQIYDVDTEFEHQKLLEWAEEYLTLGVRQQKRDPTPKHCGIGDETLSHVALSAVVADDTGLAQKLCAYATAINSPTDDGSNEWLYGRAGYLYLLRLCRTAFSQSSHHATLALLDRTIEATVERILKVAQPWVWHGKEYLGAAHGTIGIICQVVLSTPAAAPKLQQTLSDLLDRQYQSGNFPSSLPTGPDRLVQFCHGSPGFVLSLRSLLPHFPDLQRKMQDAITAAQSDIWKRGLLTKEPCLCHGIAGNALALDDPEQFAHMLAFMGSEALEHYFDHSVRNSEGASLYTGEAGRAWVWAVADQSLSRGCIGYNDL